MPPLLHFAPCLCSIVLLPHPRLAEERASAGEPHAGHSPLEDTPQPAHLVGPSEGMQSQAAHRHHVHGSGHLSTTTGRGDRGRIREEYSACVFNNEFILLRGLVNALAVGKDDAEVCLLGIGKPKRNVVLNFK